MIAIGGPAGVRAIKQAEGVRGRSLWLDAGRRLARNRAAMASLAILALVALLALFAPLLSRYPYDEIDYNVIACAPDWWPWIAACSAGGSHWFGTDAAGRDLFVRVLYGARVSLAVALVATLVSLLIGVVYGAVAGYLGGRIDALMMRLVDILYSLPFIFFVIILMVLFDRNIVLLFVAIGAVEWLTMARIVRGQTLSIKQKEFIEAARAGGVRGRDIILRHVIPNVVGPVVVYVTLTVPGVILTESFLSFLGLGIQEPLTSWGVLIFDGSEQMDAAPWLLLFPALFMTVTLFCFNFIGDGLRDALDPGSDEHVLEIHDLNVRFATPDGEVHAVKDASLTVGESECLGVVGESGSGKSQLFLAAMGLLAPNGQVTGSVRYRGQEILHAPARTLNALRGGAVTMIFQDPLTSLTPHMRVGAQIVEALTLHRKLPREEAESRAREMLDYVRIPDSARRMRQYPHELSGGMRQRVMIAMATITGPDLIIADEPTTALDVTVQAQILEILRALKSDRGTAIVLISHDMGVIAGLADRVQVMQQGAIAETGAVDNIFYSPQTNYTRMLLAAMPTLDEPVTAATATGSVLLTVDDLKVSFPVGGGLLRKPQQLRAVDGISFTLRQGETLGVVGESGCGKSTLARAVLQLLPRHNAAEAGRVVWLGRDLGAAAREEIRGLRRDFQIVFQDPMASLDPRMPIGLSIGEPLRALEPALPREQVRARVAAMMAQVGLEPGWINRYPHELSGGQNQRAGIARAMIVAPKLVVCDEAVSALDVSIQAQIVDLLRQLQADTGLSLLFISHDLAVVRRLSHRVMVLYLGRVVEMADSESLYRAPRHPYTRALLSAVPSPDPRAERARPRTLLTGDLPSPLDSRAQLTFLKSKRIDDPQAEQYRPRLIEVAPGHLVAEHD